MPSNAQLLYCSVFIACTNGTNKCNLGFNVLLGDNPTNGTTQVSGYGSYSTWNNSNN